MATVLVSFIGNGILVGHEYMSVSYHFENEVKPRKTKIFGSVLLKHLIENGRQVDSWLIMGTKESIWFDLIEIVENPDLTDEEKSLQELLFDNAFHSATGESEISQEHLTEWENVLNSRLSETKIICRLVGDASTQESQEMIFNSLNEVIKEGDEIVFDVTHGMRNQPIITTFILMYLRYAKKININDIRFYYASLDRDNKNGKVHKLDFCNQLLKATEAVAIYHQTGNYSRVGNELRLSDDFTQNISKLTFADEINRSDRQTPVKLKQELENAETNTLQSSLKTVLLEALEWTVQDSLAKRLGYKARFSFEHQQYLKAIVLLWEAILVAGCKKYGIGNPDTKEAREQSEDKLYEGLEDDRKKTLRKIEWLRNSVVHSSRTSDSDVQRALNDELAFQQLFDQGWNLFESLVST